MTTTYYALVYQAGIANVFKCSKPVGEPTSRQRVLQGDFRQCGNFCLGLHEAGLRVVPAWCNEAGDISQSRWHFTDFDQAPFSDAFLTCFDTYEQERAVETTV